MPENKNEPPIEQPPPVANKVTFTQHVDADREPDDLIITDDMPEHTRRRVKELIEREKRRDRY